MFQDGFVESSDFPKLTEELSERLSRGCWTLFGSLKRGNREFGPSCHQRQSLKGLISKDCYLMIQFSSAEILLNMNLWNNTYVLIHQDYVQLQIPIKLDGKWYVEEWLIFPHNS